MEMVKTKERKYSKTEHQKMLDEFKINVMESLGKAIEIIETTAKRVNSEELFTLIFANIAFGTVEELNDNNFGTVPAKMEKLAYYTFPFLSQSKKKVSIQDIYDVREALEDMINVSSFERSNFKVRDENTNSFDDIVTELLMYANVVRGSAYPEQTELEIVEIQGRFETWFENKIGIGPQKSILILKEVMKIIEYKFQKYLKEVQLFEKDQVEKWKKAKSHLNQLDIPEEEKREFKQLKLRDIKTSVRNYKILELAIGLPVSLLEINEVLKVTEDEWNALIDMIGFTSNKRKEVENVLELRNWPLFVLSNKRFILADISNAFDVLWDRFEQIAKSDSNFFDRYQRQRSKWLQAKSYDYLKKIFPEDCILQNLIYKDPEKDEDATAELDILISWGDILLIVELKSNQFRWESQIGDIGRLKTDLERNIGDSFSQAKRALLYINKNEEPKFIEKDTQREFVFDKTKYSRIYPLNISLHFLGGVANRKDILETLNIISDKQFPFSISISELELLVEATQKPEVFLHYIERRLAIQYEKPLFISDELDLIGAYLSSRLILEDMKDANQSNFIHFDGYSDIFMKLFNYKRGLEKKPEIKLQIPDEIEEILTRIRESSNYNKYISIMLLNQPNKILALISYLINELKKQIPSSGLFRTITEKEEDCTVCIVAIKDLSLEELDKKVLEKVELEKYRNKSSKSIGLGFVYSEGSYSIESMRISNYPWEYDPKMEKFLEKYTGHYIPVSGKKMPGRNDPCICKSGKKFKQCCLPKINITKANQLKQNKY